MKLDPSSFARAVAVVSAVLAALCSVIFAVAPQAAFRFVAWAYHSDFSGMARPVTVGGACVGLMVTASVAGGAAWLVASLYNRLASGSGPARPERP